MKHSQKQSEVIALTLEDNLCKLEKSEKVKRRLDALNALVGIAPKGSLRDVNLKDIHLERTLKNR